MKNVNGKIDDLMANQDSWSVTNFEAFLSEHGKILHPTNMCMIRIKNSLVGFYGRSPGFEMQNLAMNQKLLQRKEDLAREVLEVLSIIEPGISAAKGLFMIL